MVNPDELLKEATAKKKDGDINTAIDFIRSAYKEIEKTNVGYSVEVFLKLPMYLQEANRNDEAWREFNLLLTNGYPNQIKTLDLLPMDWSRIYDKMRLFLEREGKVLAIKFGILSYISWAIGLRRQDGREDELGEYISKENINRTLQKLLKKAKKEYLKDALLVILENYIKLLPDCSISQLDKELNEIIKEDK